MKIQALIASSALLAPVAATAGTTLPALDTPQLSATTGSGWHVSSSIYAWATQLDGDITVGRITAPVDIGFDELLDNIDFCFMGVFEAGKGRWSILADLFYAKLSPSNATRFINFDADIEQFVGNFAVFYRAFETCSGHFDLYGGARVNSVETSLALTFPRGRTIGATTEETWVDPVIGFRFHRELGGKFFVRGLADIGGFETASDLTWQAMAAVGYQINEHAAVGLGYRAIGTDYTDGALTYDVTSHGLLLGMEYRF